MLTTTERRVLQLVADGLTYRRIADRLGCCESMPATTMRRIAHKLGMAGLCTVERRRRMVYLYFTGEAML